MFGFASPRTRWLFLPLLLLLPLGCGKKTATVSGSVTLDGSPLKSGYVNFMPADGQGPSAGGEVNNGSYTAENVTPGKNRVHVDAAVRPPAGQAATSMGAAAQMPKLANPIPPNAKGNDQTVDITPGKQPLDVKLTSQ